MWLLWETGTMSVMLPELAAFLDDDEATAGGAVRFFRKMGALDAMTRARGRPLDDIVLWALLLKEPLDEACAGERDKARALADFLDPVIERIAVPRRIADGVRRIVAVLPRLEAGRAGRFARTELMSSAVDMFEVELTAAGKSRDPALKLRSTDAGAARATSARPPPIHRNVRGARPRRVVE